MKEINKYVQKSLSSLNGSAYKTEKRMVICLKTEAETVIKQIVSIIPGLLMDVY